MGRITKAHGLRGEVVVVLSTDRVERVRPGTVLQSARGQLTVVASRPHQRSWLVTFDGVVTRSAAEDLRGTVLLAAPLDEPDVDWIHELIDASVVDVHGAAIGRVIAVEDNPAADLLVLDSGALVPMTFVVTTDDGVVTVDVPEGLLDL